MSEKNVGRILLLGSRGMVGSAVCRQLERTMNVSEIIAVSRDQVDLSRQDDTFAFIASKKPDWVIVAAAKVGGIRANNCYPADFIYENLAIELNAIEGAYRAGVEKMIFLGSSCIYPKYAEQPIKEEALLNGALEPTNEPYAIAKIAGIKLCESYNRQYGTDYRSLMPTNLYGPGDNYHPLNSHVIPGLIQRFEEAKNLKLDKLKVWGTGKVKRDFLYVDDLADAICLIMRTPKQKIDQIVKPDCSHINIGSGTDIQISDLASMIRAVVGYDGVLDYDDAQPEGTPKKLLDISRISQLGWVPKTDLVNGLTKTYREYLKSR